MRTRGLLLLASLALAMPARADTTLTGPTMFQITPYLDGQSGAATGVGVEQMPALAQGYVFQLSSAILEPVGDGSFVRVEVVLDLRTYDITAAPSARHSFMLIAGLPPMAPNGVSIGFAGHFEGIQFAPGGQVALSGTAALNDANGSRWYITVSYPNAPPVNCEWAKDTNPHLINPCWLADKVTLAGSHFIGQTPARFRGTLSYLSTWAVVGPWLSAQETAGTVTPIELPSTPLPQ